MARKNVGAFAVGQLVRVHDPEDEDLRRTTWRIEAFPSRRRVKLAAVDGSATALVDLFALRPLEDA